MMAVSLPVIIYKTSSCLFLCLAACCLSLSNKINGLQTTSFTYTNTYQCYFNLTQADFVPLWPWTENWGDRLMDEIFFHNMGCDFTALSPHYCLAEGGDRSRGGSSTIRSHFNSENEPSICNKCLKHLFPTSKLGSWRNPFPFCWG